VCEILVLMFLFFFKLLVTLLIIPPPLETLKKQPMTLKKKIQKATCYDIYSHVPYISRIQCGVVL
jgi:hypothetical protein